MIDAQYFYEWEKNAFDQPWDIYMPGFHINWYLYQITLENYY